MLLCCALSAQDAEIGNEQIGLRFHTTDGRLVSFVDKGTGKELIDADAVTGPCWALRDSHGKNLLEGSPTFVGCKKNNEHTVSLTWKTRDGIVIEATVRVDDVKPLSYWSVMVSGIANKDFYDIQYPIIWGIHRMDNEDLAASSWLGSLIHDPHTMLKESDPHRWIGWESPGFLSLQLVALYDRARQQGMYFAANDTEAYNKRFDFEMDVQHSAFVGTSYPPYGTAMDTYRPSYEFVVGTLHGDWLTAAQMYREWAIDQPFCQSSRFHNGLVPRWVTNTGLWIWNRGRSDNVLSEARHLKHKLKVPVNVFWHWWHGCAYDDGFPEYLPPREGAESFKKAVREAEKDGVHCIVYMNSFQWGNSTKSWKTEGVEPYTAKRLNGSTYGQVFNIFTGHMITPMCLGTDFWRQKYAALSDSVVNTYGTSGVYMDQACISYRCSDASHGHDINGGNYWTRGFGTLTDMIREKTQDAPRDVALAGEGSGEDWMPYLDIFLNLETCRERYMGIGNTETIPICQAVYHDYAISYGSYSSLVYPPYDELWPDEFRPSNSETPLPDEFDLQYRMEQARSFVWGMQLTLANYHSFLDEDKKEEIDYLTNLVKVRLKGLKYLLYGTMEKNPTIAQPMQDIDLSRISIYAGRRGSTVTQARATRPMVYAGTWKAKDGDVATALVNISDEPQPIHFTVSTADYGLSKKCKAFLVTDKRRKCLQRTRDGELEIQMTLPARSSCLVEMK